MARKVEIELNYQKYIEHPPQTTDQMWGQACSNDNVTVNAWRKIWIDNFTANHKKFGPFSQRSVGKFFGTQSMRPVIIAGSGPSLKYNAKELLHRKDICLVSVLHNFHYFEDLGLAPEFYITLDAGEVTVEEVYEGGTKTPEEYWAMTKNRKLLAFAGTSPRLLEKWQGEVYFYNCPVPDDVYNAETGKLEQFNQYLSTGGNVLGAALYFSRAFLGAAVVGFVGADFSFSYDCSREKPRFHPWDSKYDKDMGYHITVTDVFGMPCKTWQSYHNFKSWFDFISLRVPGFYVNCTEGGTFGAYPNGNIMAVKQMELKAFIRSLTMFEEIREQAENPLTNTRKLLF